MSKTKTEIRVVCANYGTSSRHTSHVWPKATLEKAKQACIDAAHRAEMHPTAYYVGESPYRVQVREVTKWEDRKEEE